MIAATFKNTCKNKLIGYLSCCGFTIIETLPEKVQLWKQFSGGVGVLQSGCPVILQFLLSFVWAASMTVESSHSCALSIQEFFRLEKTYVYITKKKKIQKKINNKKNSGRGTYIT